MVCNILNKTFILFICYNDNVFKINAFSAPVHVILVSNYIGNANNSMIKYSEYKYEFLINAR